MSKNVDSILQPSNPDSLLLAEGANLKSVEAIPSGIIALDSILGGGLLPRTLTVLCALTGRGKSSFSVHLACAAAGYRHPVVLGFSQMVLADYASRLTAWATGEHYSRISRSYLKHLGGKLVPWDLRELGDQFFPKLEDYLTSLGNESDRTPLVIVDSLDGICSTDRLDLEATAEKLSQIAEQTGAVIFATTQANDKATDNDTVTLECARDARGKAFPASLFLGLGRSPEDDRTGTVTLTGDKNRFGPRFQVRAGVDFGCQRFFDVDDTYHLADPDSIHDPRQTDEPCDKMG